MTRRKRRKKTNPITSESETTTWHTWHHAWQLGLSGLRKHPIQGSRGSREGGCHSIKAVREERGERAHEASNLVVINYNVQCQTKMQWLLSGIFHRSRTFCSRSWGPEIVREHCSFVRKHFFTPTDILC